MSVPRPTPRIDPLLGVVLGVVMAVALPGSIMATTEDEVVSSAPSPAEPGDEDRESGLTALVHEFQLQAEQLLAVVWGAYLAAPAVDAGASDTSDTSDAARVAEASDASDAADDEVATKAGKARKPKERGPEKPSPRRRLKLVKTITGGLSPKAIVADQRGRFYATNMMYNHSITVFDRRYRRAKDMSDAVNLAKFGFREYRDKVQGAPVEAAVTPNGKKVYVSNYSMYGAGFEKPGFDLCTPQDPIDRSFVYEIDTRTLRKTDVIRVGRVPKYLAVSPDGHYLLVGNWCSWDVSVVDLREGKEVERIDAGVAPRGIAFSPNGKTAYVSLVGEDRILVIDMRTFKVKRDIATGDHPRHLVMSPNGRFLFITIEGTDKKRRADGRIVKYDTRRRKVVARSKPLIEPRTTVLADDGQSLYVVDYHAGTLVKLRASDLEILQRVRLGYHPIGVTYDHATNKVWVSGYGGVVWVLKDE